MPRKTLIQAVDFVIGAYRLRRSARTASCSRPKTRGDHWLDLSGVGSDDATGLSFSTTAAGFLTLKRFGSGPWGYVLRTTDGGRTWRPQLVGSGRAFARRARGNGVQGRVPACGQPCVAVHDQRR